MAEATIEDLRKASATGELPGGKSISFEKVLKEIAAIVDAEIASNKNGEGGKKGKIGKGMKN